MAEEEKVVVAEVRLDEDERCREGCCFREVAEFDGGRCC